MECRDTRCEFENNGTCGYRGRLLIDQNGECGTMETGVGVLAALAGLTGWLAARHRDG